MEHNIDIETSTKTKPRKVTCNSQAIVSHLTLELMGCAAAACAASPSLTPAAPGAVRDFAERHGLSEQELDSVWQELYEAGLQRAERRWAVGDLLPDDVTAARHDALLLELAAARDPLLRLLGPECFYNPYQLKCLVQLYEAIVHCLEIDNKKKKGRKCSGGDTPFSYTFDRELWREIQMRYVKRGHMVSSIVLQRRWYELCRMSRRKILHVWNHGNFKYNIAPDRNKQPNPRTKRRSLDAEPVDCSQINPYQYRRDIPLNSSGSSQSQSSQPGLCLDQISPDTHSTNSETKSMKIEDCSNSESPLELNSVEKSKYHISPVHKYEANPLDSGLPTRSELFVDPQKEYSFAFEADQTLHCEDNPVQSYNHHLSDVNQLLDDIKSETDDDLADCDLENCRREVSKSIHPLLLVIALRFPSVVTQPLESWRALVSDKRVHEFDISEWEPRLHFKKYSKLKMFKTDSYPSYLRKFRKETQRYAYNTAEQRRNDDYSSLQIIQTVKVPRDNEENAQWNNTLRDSVPVRNKEASVENVIGTLKNIDPSCTKVSVVFESDDDDEHYIVDSGVRVSEPNGGSHARDAEEQVHPKNSGEMEAEFKNKLDKIDDMREPKAETLNPEDRSGPNCGETTPQPSNTLTFTLSSIIEKQLQSCLHKVSSVGDNEQDGRSHELIINTRNKDIGPSGDSEMNSESAVDMNRNEERVGVRAAGGQVDTELREEGENVFDFKLLQSVHVNIIPFHLFPEWKRHYKTGVISCRRFNASKYASVDAVLESARAHDTMKSRNLNISKVVERRKLTCPLQLERSAPGSSPCNVTNQRLLQSCRPCAVRLPASAGLCNNPLEPCAGVGGQSSPRQSNSLGRDSQANEKNRKFVALTTKPPPSVEELTYMIRELVENTDLRPVRKKLHWPSSRNFPKRKELVKKIMELVSRIPEWSKNQENQYNTVIKKIINCDENLNDEPIKKCRLGKKKVPETCLSETPPLLNEYEEWERLKSQIRKYFSLPYLKPPLRSGSDNCEVKQRNGDRVKNVQYANKETRADELRESTPVEPLVISSDDEKDQVDNRSPPVGEGTNGNQLLKLLLDSVQKSPVRPLTSTTPIATESKRRKLHPLISVEALIKSCAPEDTEPTPIITSVTSLAKTVDIDDANRSVIEQKTTEDITSPHIQGKVGKIYNKNFLESSIANEPVTKKIAQFYTGEKHSSYINFVVDNVKRTMYQRGDQSRPAGNGAESDSSERSDEIDDARLMIEEKIVNSIADKILNTEVVATAVTIGDDILGKNSESIEPPNQGIARSSSRFIYKENVATFVTPVQVENEMDNGNIKLSYLDIVNDPQKENDFTFETSANVGIGMNNGTIESPEQIIVKNLNACEVANKKRAAPFSPPVTPSSLLATKHKRRKLHPLTAIDALIKSCAPDDTETTPIITSVTSLAKTVDIEDDDTSENEQRTTEDNATPHIVGTGEKNDDNIFLESNIVNDSVTKNVAKFYTDEKHSGYINFVVNNVKRTMYQRGDQSGPAGIGAESDSSGRSDEIDGSGLVINVNSILNSVTNKAPNGVFAARATIGDVVGGVSSESIEHLATAVNDMNNRAIELSNLGKDNFPDSGVVLDEESFQSPVAKTESAPDAVMLQLPVTKDKSQSTTPSEPTVVVPTPPTPAESSSKATSRTSQSPPEKSCDCYKPGRQGVPSSLQTQLTFPYSSRNLTKPLIRLDSALPLWKIFNKYIVLTSENIYVKAPLFYTQLNNAIIKVMPAKNLLQSYNKPIPEFLVCVCSGSQLAKQKCRLCVAYHGRGEDSYDLTGEPGRLAQTQNEIGFEPNTKLSGKYIVDEESLALNKHEQSEVSISSDNSDKEVGTTRAKDENRGKTFLGRKNCDSCANISDIKDTLPERHRAVPKRSSNEIVLNTKVQNPTNDANSIPSDVARKRHRGGGCGRGGRAGIQYLSRDCVMYEGKKFRKIQDQPLKFAGELERTDPDSSKGESYVIINDELYLRRPREPMAFRAVLTVVPDPGVARRLVSRGRPLYLLVLRSGQKHMLCGRNRWVDGTGPALDKFCSYLFGLPARYTCSNPDLHPIAPTHTAIDETHKYTDTHVQKISVRADDERATGDEFQ